MIRAHKHRAYRDVTDFAAPEGVVSAQIDADTGGIATNACPKVVTEYYLLGTQPVQFCTLHQGGSTQIAGWDTPAAPASPRADGGDSADRQPVGSTQAEQRNKNPDKKSFFDRLKDIFR
jgi:penicillin-binding protein 1B